MLVLAAAVLLVPALAACGSSGSTPSYASTTSLSSGGHATSAQLTTLKAGDCSNTPAPPTKWDLAVSHVPCAQAHGYEVVFDKVLPGNGSYPKGLKGMVSNDCRGSFAKYVGIDASAVPSVSAWVMFPDQSDWANHQHHALCLIAPPVKDPAATLTGSAKGKRGAL